MKILLAMAVLAMGAYIALAAFLYLYQGRFLYFPTTAAEDAGPTPDRLGLKFESVRFTAADGTALHGWFVPAEQARITILFFHGNAGNIRDRIDSIALLHRLGYSVFAIDYRGYGSSAGQPDEAGTYADARGAWDYLRNVRNLPAETIVVFGRSLGGAMAAQLATQVQPAALILESTFTSVPDMAAAIYPFLPVRRLARIRYNTLARAPAILCPVLVVHSPDDRIIPFDHGRSLYDALTAPRQFLEIRGPHNGGYLQSGALYSDGVAAFISRWVSVSPDSAQSGVRQGQPAR